MKTMCKRNGMAVALLCGLAFTSTTVSAQLRPVDDWQFVPVGPPASYLSYARAVQQPFFGAIKRPSRAGREVLRRSLEGIDFIGSNCNCLPPDTNAAVGNDFVTETVNLQIRIWNKTLGNILLDEPLATLFGAPPSTDPYVVYDDIATSLPVTQYQNAPRADQPGGFITTFPNTTTTQVQFHRSHLLTAMASGTASDGFTYPKSLIYDVDVTSGTPTLSKEFVINPGTGVAAQMPSVDMDQSDRLGVTWMESSANEFLSMWVATLDQSTGKLVSTVAAGGVGFFSVNFRIGDYSTTVLDPDGVTFWSANEYIGDAPNTDIWRTNITSFTAGDSQNAIALNSNQ